MIPLGSKVKDKITGFTGIATAKVEYINGCVQYCIKPPVAKDNKLIEGEYFDAQQLEVIGKVMQLDAEPTGGPQPDCPK